MNGVSNEQTQVNAGPATIEDAFKMLRQNDQQATAPAVGDGELGDGAESGDASTGAGGAAEAQQLQTEGATQGEDGLQPGGESDGSTGSDDLPGGYAAAGEEAGEPGGQLEPAVDYGQVGQAYIKSTQDLAVQAANKLFQEQGVTKVSINDLFVKDERGRVSFTNPDDPDRPFASRAEAQAWCDAFNSQVDNEWKNTVRNYQQGYMKDIQPMLRLMDFAPEFEAMTPQQQKVFDNVVDSYAVRDSNGDVIGYSCDLRQAKQVALNICKDMGINEQQQAQQQAAASAPVQGGGPAVDAKTSGSGNPQNEKHEPKDLSEAMKMIADQRKKERESK